MEPEMELRIRERAYEIWDADGRPEGHAHDHWLIAEREISEVEPERYRSPKTITSTPVLRTHRLRRKS